MAVDVAVFMEEHGFTPEEAAVVTEETDHLEELILADDGDLEDIAESFLLLPRLRFLRVVREARAADFEAAIAKLSSSVADAGPEMAKVLEWNAQYGEVKKRTKAAQSSLYL